MIYLLALIFPISLLYSPKVEKSGAVYVAKTMHITHERKTPAYTLFQQAQKVTHPEMNRQPSSLESKAISGSEILSLNQVDQTKVEFPDATVVSEMSLNKQDLLTRTDLQLGQLVAKEKDSLLLNKIQNPFANTKQSTRQAASIQGFFELSGGVGLTNQTVTVRRVREGQSIELGQVDLKAGMYQIFVGSFDGELVAEIKDENGIIIGEDRKRISGLVRQNNYFQGPQLKLGRPSGFAVNLRNIDDRKIKDTEVAASLFSGNYGLKKTTDVYPNVARHSSTVALIDSAGGKLARTLSIRTANDPSEVVLFSTNWIEGAKSYLSEKIQIQYMSDAGIIIGRVMLDGKPVAGAQVVVENQPGLEPYYLDQFLIPQVQQSNTTSNGYFIIPGLQEGSYQISAFIQNRHIGSQAYFVERSVASYQEILAITNVKISTARSFDAFSGQNIPTDLQIPGLEDLLTVAVESATYVEGTQSGLVEVINRPMQRDYIPYIYLQNQSKDFIHLPQLTEKFIEYISQQHKINPETSFFIGFVQMKNFEVTLTDETFDRHNIVYFGATGEVSMTPIANGGFAIFNVPVGTTEVIVENKDNEKIFSQAFYSKSSMTYLAHFAD
jgi:hypothetical protein